MKRADSFQIMHLTKRLNGLNTAVNSIKLEIIEIHNLILEKARKYKNGQVVKYQTYKNDFWQTGKILGAAIQNIEPLSIEYSINPEPNKRKEGFRWVNEKKIKAK